MKLFILAIFLALIAVATATSIPWKSCDDNSIITITDIDSGSWPPVPGGAMTTVTKGKASVDIPGTYGTWEIATKWNGMSVDNKKGDLCAFGDISCPLKAGDIAITNAGTFPSNAPSGSYVMRTLAKDAQGNTVFCYTLSFTV